MERIGQLQERHGGAGHGGAGHGGAENGGAQHVGAQLNNGSSSINDISILQGEIGAVAAFGVIIPPVQTASKVVVNVTLDISGERVATNEWTLSVFPEVSKTLNPKARTLAITLGELQTLNPAP